MREGYEPERRQPPPPGQEHNLDAPFSVGDDEDEETGDNLQDADAEADRWERRDVSTDSGKEHQDGGSEEERNPWASDDAGRS